MFPAITIRLSRRLVEANAFMKLHRSMIELSSSVCFIFYILSGEINGMKFDIRDEIKISFPINIEMSVYSQ
ncbi:MULTISPECIES: hypothetical protein, partial [Klebsiella]|uniref:hypothetical protein n=1 Tax=Klebsiella TaxID=570 RepID=UPI001CCFC4AB